eukprot:6090310-Amphidinium_carterae.1
MDRGRRQPLAASQLRHHPQMEAPSHNRCPPNLISAPWSLYVVTSASNVSSADIHVLPSGCPNCSSFLR